MQQTIVALIMLPLCLWTTWLCIAAVRERGIAGWWSADDERKLPVLGWFRGCAFVMLTLCSLFGAFASLLVLLGVV